ncbi:MAG: phosphoglycerate kinase [Paracoccaceae bacterium]
MAFRTIEDMDVAGQRVLVRVDINVPVEDGRVTDDTRMRRIKPTVDAIRDAGGMAILLAHFGRPKGAPDPDLSLRQLVPALSKVLGCDVGFADGGYGDAAQAMSAGDVLLLENVRFNPGETKDDAGFAQRLASLGDIYCNDAFSAAHRAHASTHALARLLPACAGLSMAAELRALEAALGAPERPVMAVVGGAKVSTKLELLGNLVSRVDILAIGGGMANTFLAAQGLDVGTSLAEHEMTGTARDIAEAAATAGCEILLPRDVVVAREFAAGSPHETVMAEDCPPDRMILDIGPDSVAHLTQAMERARTLVWNGPLGAFEIAPFDAGTVAAARAAAELTQGGALTSIAGGGDTVAALAHAGVEGEFTYVSTAGGAFLEWMEGKTLPGVAALERAAG